MINFRFTTVAALACAAAANLSACSGLGGLGIPGSTPAAAVGQINSQIDAFNAAASQHCSGWGNLDWTPPLPPTGSLHAKCEFGGIGQTSPAAPPPAAPPVAVPLSQAASLIAPAAAPK